MAKKPARVAHVLRRQLVAGLEVGLHAVSCLEEALECLQTHKRESADEEPRRRCVGERTKRTGCTTCSDPRVSLREHARAVEVLRRVRTGGTLAFCGVSGSRKAVAMRSFVHALWKSDPIRTCTDTKGAPSGTWRAITASALAETAGPQRKWFEKRTAELGGGNVRPGRACTRSLRGRAGERGDAVRSWGCTPQRGDI